MLFDTELAASMLDDSDDPADLEQEFEKCKKQDCIKNALIQVCGQFLQSVCFG